MRHFLKEGIMARPSIIYRFLNMYWWGLSYVFLALFVVAITVDSKKMLDFEHETKGPYMTDQLVEYAPRAIFAAILSSIVLLSLEWLRERKQRNPRG